jgi:hypothetical protein
MTTANCKATIVIGNATVTFEGPAEFVEAQVLRYADQSHFKQEIKNDGMVNTESQQEGAPLTERELLERKRPSGHAEIATVLAFALTANGMEEFGEDDIRRAYIRAGVRPPKVVAQALRDAKSKYDYISNGSKRGVYKLTNHGDRTVRFDLPR